MGRAPLGLAAQTGTVLYSCACGQRYRADVRYVVERREAAAVLALQAGQLNVTSCPSCHRSARVEVAVLEHDEKAQRLTLHLPDALRHRELDERARLLRDLANAATPPPEYALNPTVRFMPPAAAAGDTETVDRTAPAPKEAAEPELRALDDVVASGNSTPTRARVRLPDLRRTALERWAQQRDAATAFFIDDAVSVCATTDAETAAHLREGLELRLQVHRLPTYPVVTITLLGRVAAAAADPNSEARPALLMVPLDVGRAAHRAVLQALAKRCAFSLELHDESYRPLFSLSVAAPLEANVPILVAAARDAFGRLSAAQRDFARARVLLSSTSYERIGRLNVRIPSETLPLEKPSQVWAALAEVRRWSEPNAEAYLVEVQSQPVAAWSAARARIVARALVLGFAVSRSLFERAAPLLPSQPPWRELVIALGKRLLVTSADRTNFDLSIAEQAEAWEQIIELCRRSEVKPEQEVELAAAQARQRARLAESGGGLDLRTLPTGDLVALLDEARLRRQAALLLCERHEAQTLTALFGALRRMPRAEANAVLPAVTAFGAPAERWLIEGLRSKKSYMRQGCALAIGALATRRGADALVQLLLDEPTEIWGEVARALGDTGAIAVTPLCARLRDVDEEGQQRITVALAHIGARDGGALRPLLAGKDVLVRAAAERAIEQQPEIERAAELLRRGTSEQTVVRGFSRRFYDGLKGTGAGGDSLKEGTGSIELSADDVLEADTGEVELPTSLGEPDDEPGGEKGARA